MGILTVSCDGWNEDGCGVILNYDYNKTHHVLAWFFCEKCYIKYELARAKEELEEWVENPRVAHTNKLKKEVLQWTKKLNNLSKSENISK